MIAPVLEVSLTSCLTLFKEVYVGESSHGLVRLFRFNIPSPPDSRCYNRHRMNSVPHVLLITYLGGAPQFAASNPIAIHRLRLHHHAQTASILAVPQYMLSRVA
jgi:hypothetical protein